MGELPGTSPVSAIEGDMYEGANHFFLFVSLLGFSNTSFFIHDIHDALSFCE